MLARKEERRKNEEKDTVDLGEVRRLTKRSAAVMAEKNLENKEKTGHIEDEWRL